MSKAMPEEITDIRARINEGPWETGQSVYGHTCQLCREQIFSVNEAYIREGDDLSPALYRHKTCHELPTPVVLGLCEKCLAAVPLNHDGLCAYCAHARRMSR